MSVELQIFQHMCLENGLPIEQSTTTGSPASRIFQVRFHPKRREVLQKGNWKFAQGRKRQLQRAEVSEEELHPYKFAFYKPSDYVQGATIEYINGALYQTSEATNFHGAVLRKRRERNGYDEYDLREYAETNDKIFTLLDNIRAIYVRDLPIEEWDDPLAIEILGLYLVLEAAETLSDERNIKQDTLRRIALLEAQIDSHSEQMPSINIFDNPNRSDQYWGSPYGKYGAGGWYG